MSSRPKWLATSFILSSTSLLDVASNSIPRVRRPSALISLSTVFAPSPCVRHVMATSAPDSARPLAMALPIPTPPPVTRATFPASADVYTLTPSSSRWVPPPLLRHHPLPKGPHNQLCPTSPLFALYTMSPQLASLNEQLAAKAFETLTYWRTPGSYGNPRITSAQQSWGQWRKISPGLVPGLCGVWVMCRCSSSFLRSARMRGVRLFRLAPGFLFLSGARSLSRRPRGIRGRTSRSAGACTRTSSTAGP